MMNLVKSHFQNQRNSRQQRRPMVVAFDRRILTRLKLFVYLMRERGRLHLKLGDVLRMCLTLIPFWEKSLLKFPNHVFKEALWHQLKHDEENLAPIALFHLEAGKWQLEFYNLQSQFQKDTDIFCVFENIYEEISQVFRAQHPDKELYQLDGRYYAKPKAYYRQKILASDEIQQLLHHNSKFSAKETKNLVEKYIKEIVCDRHYAITKGAHYLTQTLLKKLFHTVKLSGHEKIRELEKKYQIVYLPAHRSHMDFLALSSILHVHGIRAPYIAASHHLNFFPVSFLGRVSAYFIRREKMNAIYNAVLYQYIALLHRDGYSQMVFVEGTRSKTGETLQPKVGIVSSYINAFLEHKTRPLVFVPINVTYDFVMEGDSYLSYIIKSATAASEINDTHREAYLQYRKQEKNLSFLQKLKRRFRLIKELRPKGNAYFTCGQPIFLENILQREKPDYASLEIRRDGAIPDKWIRELARSISKQACIEINRVAPVTSVSMLATALLSSQEKALTESELEAFFSDTMDIEKNLFGTPASEFNENFIANLDHVAYLNHCRRQRDRRSHIAAERQRNNRSGDRRQQQKIFITPLDQLRYTYCKNNVVHKFVIPSIIAQAFQNYGKLSEETIREFFYTNYQLYQDRFHLSWTVDDAWSIAGNCIDYWLDKRYFIRAAELISINEDNEFPKRMIGLYGNILTNSSQAG
ncbi:MAG: 1-acyl-sn-glycerol-3-phosphate acyltransferase [Oligoflexus sp.]